jgi:hypothetical protein
MKALVLYLIELYHNISPLFPAKCKFYPSCSYYTEEAFRKYPFFKALLFSLKRILKCNWFSHGGIDFLP